ncbi:putative carbohydrate binding protein [Opitutaceae bacterium TAV1]|nr:putative carbohydrate binding protein [Opitutaceae bacterium TAV1]
MKTTVLIRLLRGVLLSATLLVTSALFAAPSSPAIAPEFQSDGSIESGACRVILRDKGQVSIIDGDGGASYDVFLPFGNYKDVRNGGWNSPKKLFKGARLDVDAERKTTTFTARAEPPGGNPFEVRWSIALTNENRVRVAIRYDLAEPVKNYLNAGMHIHVARDALVGSDLQIGEETFPIAAGAPVSDASAVLKKTWQKPQSVAFNANRPPRRIVLHPVSDMSVSFNDNNRVTYRPPFVAVSLGQRGNELVFDIELPPPLPPQKQSDETYAGIDFWHSDCLRMPDYRASKNLVQNPGFEAGFNYWRWNTLGSMPLPPAHNDYYAISDRNPHSGQRSLALRGEPGQSPAQVATFAIPVRKGRIHTLSFYARADGEGQKLSVNAQSFFSRSPFAVSKTVAIKTGWSRHTFTFRTHDSVLSIGFGNHKPSAEGWIYVDGVQLEEGETATAFATKPFLAWLEGGRRGRLWQPGENPDARARISGAPDASGELRIVQTDFFGAETDRGALPFRLDASGEASLPLPWAAHLPRGIFSFALKITTDDGKRGTDYDRFTVMPFLENRHAQKNLFAINLNNSRYAEWDREAEFYQRAGIGSGILFNPDQKGYHEMLDRHGILHLSSIFDAGHGFDAMKWHAKKNGFLELTGEQLQQIEDNAFAKAAAHPEVNYWKLNNEPPTTPNIHNLPAMRKMNAALLAARRGILRASPSARIVGSDPANMYANSGMAFIDTQLEALAGEKLYDIAAIHPYRARPESPDRDAETARFLDILDNRKFTGPVWFTEGIYHQNYIVPAWDLNSHAGCTSDHYRAGPLSYAMGWGERMAAAYTARSWLVSLKYSDRVKMDVDWGFRNNSFSDVNLSPMAAVFAANTLGHILGDATYKATLVLGYETRCYVFEDARRRPVAAIWYHNIESDKGTPPPPSLDISAFGANGLRFADFMGDEHNATKTLKLGPFPVFILGETGGTDALANTLKQCSLLGANGDLHAWLALKSDARMELAVENTVAREFRGTTVTSDDTGREIRREKITIAGQSIWTRPLPLDIKPDTLQSTRLRLEIIPENGEAQRFDLAGHWMRWPRRKHPVSLAGKPEEWADAFHLKMPGRLVFSPYGLPAPELRQYREKPVQWAGDDDLSATLSAMWDETALYLAFTVRDDVHHPNATPASAWKGDSVQLYFDAWADARKNRDEGYGPDDQSFQVWSSLNETAVWRDTAPERQLAFLDLGPAPGIRAKVTRIDDNTTFYELALPLAELNPLRLNAGSCFGFAALVNDHDGDYRKSALTLAPSNLEPGRRPQTWPTVILDP